MQSKRKQNTKPSSNLSLRFRRKTSKMPILCRKTTKPSSKLSQKSRRKMKKKPRKRKQNTQPSSKLSQKSRSKASKMPMLCKKTTKPSSKLLTKSTSTVIRIPRIRRQTTKPYIASILQILTLLPKNRLKVTLNSRICKENNKSRTERHLKKQNLFRKNCTNNNQKCRKLKTSRTKVSSQN